LLEPGSVVHDRYRIVGAIGQGGQVAVYEAEDVRLQGRRCAIKEIRFDPEADEETRRQAEEQFRREADILARLDHPTLPKVSDFFSEEEYDYLVMDFVPGPNLKEVMDETVKAGVKLMVCEQSTQLINLTRGDFIPAAEIVGAATLNDLVLEADGTMWF